MTTLSRDIGFALLAVAGLFACTSTVDEAGVRAAANQVAVQVEPPSAQVTAGGSVSFAATVTGSANTAVTWTVQEGSPGGSITTSGQYTAPATSGAYHVVATSQADPTKASAAAVTVTPVVAVAVSPPTATVAAGGSLTFTAAVTGTTNTAVAWSVQEASGCGSVTQAGVYTAPAVGATCHVVATSSADPTKRAVATVTVTPPPPPVTVAINPSTANVNSCRTFTFSATVGGTSNGAVTWSVQEGAAGGSITAGGVYTAPSSAGTYHVVATSQADATKSAVATVTVTDQILSVTVSPAQTAVPVGGSVQFTATVTTSCGSFTSTTAIAAASN